MEITSTDPGSLGSELRGDARTVTDSARQRFHSEVDARKSGAVGQAKDVSSAISRAGEQLGENAPSWLRSVFDSAAQTVQRLADTVEQKDSRQLTGDVQRIARENPGSFLAACAVGGFAAARVMQAGSGNAAQPTGSSGAGASGFGNPAYGGGGQDRSVYSGSAAAGQSYRPAMGLPAGAEPYAVTEHTP